MSAIRRLLPTLFMLGCDTETDVPMTAAQRGAEIVHSRSISPSALNSMTCLTCHRAQASDRPFAMLPGATFSGATLRRAFWGGEEVDLLRAINVCRFYFMYSSDPWSAANPDASSVYAYLDGLSPTSADEASVQPFTVVRTLADLPRGNADAGKVIFERACQTCHGEPSSGAGRLSTLMPVLPEQAVRDHEYLKSRDKTRLVFIQKVRHGAFLGYGGSMPPFSTEVLADHDLGDLLTFLGLF